MKLEKIVEQVGIFLYEYYVDLNGLKQGILKKYNLDKSLCEEIEYKDDYLNGKVLKYEENKIVYEGDYLKNKLDGFLKEYYKNNNLKSCTTYKMGKLEGEKIEYFENGKISTITNYFNDKLNGEKKRFYESGILKFEGYYKDNNMCRIWKWYDKDGSLLKIKEY